MARRNLTTRQTMRGVSAIDGGARIIVAKAITVGPGKVLLPGEDVTEEARTWSTLSTHFKRGYLTIVEFVEPPASRRPPLALVDLSALRELNATASKMALKSALALSGVTAPDDATRIDLLRIRSEVLKEADGGA